MTNLLKKIILIVVVVIVARFAYYFAPTIPYLVENYKLGSFSNDPLTPEQIKGRLIKVGDASIQVPAKVLIDKDFPKKGNVNFNLSHYGGGTLRLKKYPLGVKSELPKLNDLSVQMKIQSLLKKNEALKLDFDAYVPMMYDSGKTKWINYEYIDMTKIGSRIMGYFFCVYENNLYLLYYFHIAADLDRFKEDAVKMLGHVEFPEKVPSLNKLNEKV